MLAVLVLACDGLIALGLALRSFVAMADDHGRLEGWILLACTAFAVNALAITYAADGEMDE